jgi:N-acyl-D-amino-acid deacylase
MISIISNTFTIRGATVVDGSGSVGVKEDVVIVDGYIAEVGKLIKGNERGKIVDGSDLTLAPGFIDMHSHSDLGVIADKAHLSKVTQGVTLEVVGQDGLSYVPSNEKVQAELRAQLYGWNGTLNDHDWNFNSVSQYLGEVDKGCAVNVAYLMPHGTIRMLVRGMNEGVSSAEDVKKMQEILRTGMQEGAFGMSAGLTYVPAMYSDTRELIELCKVVSECGGYFAPHHRSYGAKIFESIAECIEISKESAVPLHLTHCHLNAPMYHGRANELLKLLDDASRQGIDISLDTYPYTSGSSYLHMMLPSWVQAGGIEQLRIRLREPEVQKKVIDALDHTGSDGNHGGVVNWDNVVIAGVEKAENKKYVGIAISKLAVSQNKLASQLYIDLVLSEDCKASMVVFGGNEENVRTIMKDSRHTVGSDGILHGDRPHPRAFGTFARFLGHYSRDEQMFPLEEAVTRMTGRPAMRLGLQDRGFIREGYKADLVLFDHESVADRSTFESPRLPASGFEYVWINGIPTLEKGERTNFAPGKGIRKTTLTHQGGNNAK